MFEDSEYLRRLSAVDLSTCMTILEERDGPVGYLRDFSLREVTIRSPTIVAFYHAYSAAARRRSIPIFLSWCDEHAGMILHGHYHGCMTNLHWEALVAVGNDAARSQSFSVEYIGNGVWAERKAERRSEAAMAAARGMVISPLSGRWQTHAERVLEAEKYARGLQKRL